MKTVTVILVVMVIAVLPGASRAAAQAGGTAAESLFAQGQQAFDEALAKHAGDPVAAADSFRAAASIWQSLADDHGIHNGRLLYNIGNAHLLAGDVGPAILAYRRAERYIAGDRHLAANLDLARRRVRTSIETSGAARARGMLLFWHESWSQRTRMMLMTILWGAGWLWTLARLNGRLSAAPRWPGWAALALALVFSASLAADLAAGPDRGGVVMRETIGRKGPSDIGYEPSFTEPLAEGVEFAVVEDRGPWLLVRLRDGRETWLPRSSVELVLSASAPRA